MVWQASKNCGTEKSTHEKCGLSVDRVLQFSAFKRTFDNITAVMIAFENFENIAGQHHSSNKALVNDNANSLA